MKLVLASLVAAGLYAQCLPVTGEHIVAGDLAASNPVFAGLPPATPLVYAPAAGVRRVLHLSELRRAARQQHLETAGLREVCFEWPMRVPTSESLAAAMRSTLAMPVEIVDQSRYPVPPGEIVFPRTMLAAAGGDGSAPLLWRGYVRYARRTFPIWARIRTSAPLPPAEPRAPRDVAAGDTVQVEVRSGGTRLLSEARADSAGRRGDFILVRNPDSGRRYRARVEGRGKVLVSLAPAGAGGRE